MIMYAETQICMYTYTSIHLRTNMHMHHYINAEMHIYTCMCTTIFVHRCVYTDSQILINTGCADDDEQFDLRLCQGGAAIPQDAMASAYSSLSRLRQAICVVVE